jgi:UDPglucose--hexose-1-phosphate uridylyltransferase
MAHDAKGAEGAVKMSELREDPLTGLNTIVAPHRHGRPSDRVRLETLPRPDSLPREDPSCPFCPAGGGAEAKPILSIPDLETGGWRARIVPNAFPIVQREAPAEVEPPALPGLGRHEVIVETPRHDLDLPDLTPDAFRAVVEITLARMRQLTREPETAALFVFRNHGAVAGSSLVHGHGQILALPFVPTELARREAHLAAAHERIGRNPFAAALEAERADGRRIVAERPGFCAYVPFAAEAPFELRIQPERDSADPFDLDPAEIGPLSDLLRDCLMRLRLKAGDPAYNLIWSTMSRARRRAPFAGWCLRILPRRVPGGGFERASGVSILSSTPEADAVRLRGR